MAVHIRLARYGSKKSPFYRIVVTDQRNKRDGRFIENIGTVDPRTSPATVQLNRERLSFWRDRGAQLSDTLARVVKLPSAVASSATSEG